MYRDKMIDSWQHALRFDVTIHLNATTADLNLELDIEFNMHAYDENWTKFIIVHMSVKTFDIKWSWST